MERLMTVTILMYSVPWQQQQQHVSHTDCLCALALQIESAVA